MYSILCEPIDERRPRHHELQRIADRYNLHFQPCHACLPELAVWEST